MTRVTFAALVALSFAMPTLAADQQPNFLMVTITDLGRPYTVLDGACAYGRATGFNIMNPEFESAFQTAAERLSAIAKAHGGDAVVGMQAMPISESAGDRNGVLVCGTVVKLK
jgi:hypothetical protein